MPGFVRVMTTIKRCLAASMGVVFAEQSVGCQITVFVSPRYSMAMVEDISGRRSCVKLAVVSMDTMTSGSAHGGASRLYPPFEHMVG